MNSTRRELTDCHDCGAKPGEIHQNGCDVERCSMCGGQRLMCDGDEDCNGHDPVLSYWTGEWPGKEACRELGLYSRFVPGQGWVSCGPHDEGAAEDLNTWTLIVARIRQKISHDPAITRGSNPL